MEIMWFLSHSISRDNGTFAVKMGNHIHMYYDSINMLVRLIFCFFFADRFGFKEAVG